MKRILVLLHKRDTGFSSFDYLVKLLIKEWTAAGLAVDTMRGTGRHVPADLLIPHVDLTIRPAAYRAFLHKYAHVMNKSLSDISKSRISSNLVGRDDPYSGPVIVKTERNYGGLPEGQLATSWQKMAAIPGKARDKLRSKFYSDARPVPWKRVRSLPPAGYPVFSSLRDVPEEIFANSALVVEKFLPEIEGDKYLVRSNFFFGDKDFNSVLRSSEPIVKRASAVQTQEGSTPAEIHSFRQRLGVDYGKIDYVRREGKAFIFDLNPTPCVEGGGFGEAVARHLAPGIWSKLT